MFKVSKKGRTVHSNNVRDLLYWDKYRVIPFVKKLQFDVDLSGATSGSHAEEHGQQYAPLCKGQIRTVGVTSGGASGGVNISTPVDSFFTAPLFANPTCYDPIATSTFTASVFEEKYTLKIDSKEVTLEWEVTGSIPGLNDGYIQSSYSKRCIVWVFGLPLGKVFDSTLYKG